MSVHRAVFVRHSKAKRYSAGGDINRSLTDEGRQRARYLGQKLSAYLHGAGKILVSPATRAQETLTEILAGAGVELGSIPCTEVPAIYFGGAEEILDALRTWGEGKVVVIVGHEPTISEVANLVAGPSLDVPAGVPVASAITIEADQEWADWWPHIGKNSDFLMA
jgi:Phosphohistidine phosphatase SixA